MSAETQQVNQPEKIESPSQEIDSVARSSSSTSSSSPPPPDAGNNNNKSAIARQLLKAASSTGAGVHLSRQKLFRKFENKFGNKEATSLAKDTKGSAKNGKKKTGPKVEMKVETKKERKVVTPENDTAKPQALEAGQLAIAPAASKGKAAAKVGAKAKAGAKKVGAKVGAKAKAGAKKVGAKVGAKAKAGAKKLGAKVGAKAKAKVHAKAPAKMATKKAPPQAAIGAATNDKEAKGGIPQNEKDMRKLADAKQKKMVEAEKLRHSKALKNQMDEVQVEQQTHDITLGLYGAEPDTKPANSLSDPMLQRLPTAEAEAETETESGSEPKLTEAQKQDFIQMEHAQHANQDQLIVTSLQEEKQKEEQAKEKQAQEAAREKQRQAQEAEQRRKALEERKQRKAKVAAMATAFAATNSAKIKQVTQASQAALPQVASAASSAKSQIEASVNQSKAELTQKFAALNAQASQKAADTRQQLQSQQKTVAEAIKNTTKTTLTTLEQNHQTASSKLEQSKSQQVSQLTSLYSTWDAKFRAIGPKMVGEVDSHVNTEVSASEAGKIHKDDSLLDGPFTDSKKQARIDAAKAVGAEYKKGLVEEANKQADQIKAGLAKDIENVNKAITEGKTVLTTKLSEAKSKLAQKEAQNISQLDQAVSSQMQSIGSSLQAYQQASNQQKTAAIGKLTQEGSQSKAQIDQTAQAISSQISAQAAAAASQLQAAIQQIVGKIQQIDDPDDKQIASSFAQAQGQIDKMIQSSSNQFKEMATGAKQGMDTTGKQTSNSLKSTSQAESGQAEQAAQGFSTSQASLLNGAKTMMGQLQQAFVADAQGETQQFDAVLKEIESGVGKFFADCNAQMGTAFGKMSTDIEANFRNALKELDSVIQREAGAAEGKVQPRWKGLLKILIAVVVIVVIAIVAAPLAGALAGAMVAGGMTAGLGTTLLAGAIVGAGLGAAGAAVNTVSGNLLDGNAWNKDLGSAMLKGAITGAVGGVISGAAAPLLKGASALTGATGVLTRAGINGVTGTVTGTTSTIVANIADGKGLSGLFDGVSPTSILKDFAIGAAGSMGKDAWGRFKPPAGPGPTPLGQGETFRSRVKLEYTNAAVKAQGLTTARLGLDQGNTDMVDKLMGGVTRPDSIYKGLGTQVGITALGKAPDMLNAWFDHYTTPARDRDRIIRQVQEQRRIAPLNH